MTMARFMVIESFRGGDPEPVYARFHAMGRMLPEGLHYVDSWLTADTKRCFQLMDTGEPALFDVWTGHWADPVDFEIVPLCPKGNYPDGSAIKDGE